METESIHSTWLKDCACFVGLVFLASSRIVSNDEECPPWFFYNTCNPQIIVNVTLVITWESYIIDCGILLKTGNCMMHNRNVGTLAKCY